MLTSQQKKSLKARAHRLKPVVITGAAGVTAPVLTEIDLALEHHGLIKVRVNADTPPQRAELAQSICAQLQAESVQMIGHVLTLYREPPPETGQPRKTRGRKGS